MNALRIREIAAQHQIPIIENKPLARMMFKYGWVGGEIPAQLYVAVAEILAYVYRTNAYRYYREQVGPLLARPSDVVVHRVAATVHALDPGPPDPAKLG